MTNKIENIGDMMAYACNCGSVHFNLLKSKKIECAGCNSKFGNWENNNLANMLLDQQLAIVADGLQIPVEILKQVVEMAKQPAQEPAKKHTESCFQMSTGVSTMWNWHHLGYSGDIIAYRIHKGIENV